MKRILNLIILLTFSLSFSQTPTTFFNIKSVNGFPSKGTLLANPKLKLKLDINSKKVILSRKVILGDDLEDQYTLYFKDEILDYKIIFYNNSVKVYKSVNNEYKLIYDIETYETNTYFNKKDS